MHGGRRVATFHVTIFLWNIVVPIYAYKCSACGHAQDVLQKISDPLLTTCPECAQETYAKQVTAAGFQLKGSGWYVTDFRNGSGSGSASAKPGDSATSSADSASGSTDSASASGGTASKPAESPAATPSPPAATSA